MVARLIVVLLIFLSLEIGVILILFPWINIGVLADWGDNYLLVLVCEKMGMPSLRSFIDSGWVRGAVTGLGILNVLLAFWEMFHFQESVEMLEGKDKSKKQLR
jgi:hypothetical protein